MKKYSGKKTNSLGKIANIALLTASFIFMPTLERRISGDPYCAEQNYSNKQKSSLVGEKYSQEDNFVDTRCLMNYKTELINDKLVNAIIEVESNGNPYAVSKKGAKGLMQLTYEAWKQIELKLSYSKNVFNPKINKEVGTRYLEWIENFCEDNHPTWNILPLNQKRNIIAAAYNGGPAKLKKNNWDIKKMPCETKNYVGKISNINF